MQKFSVEGTVNFQNLKFPNTGDQMKEMLSQVRLQCGDGINLRFYKRRTALKNALDSGKQSGAEKPFQVTDLRTVKG